MPALVQIFVAKTISDSVVHS